MLDDITLVKDSICEFHDRKSFICLTVSAACTGSRNCSWLPFDAILCKEFRQ